VRRVVRNITWMLLSQSVTWGLALVLLVLAPRWLGDFNFGKAFVATTFVGFVELLANLGTATYVTKEIARKAIRNLALLILQFSSTQERSLPSNSC
jgi:O-antigen/teichoic acid export membrane protein